MNVDLIMSKLNSKFTFSWNSIKKFEHGKDEFGGWKVCKILMVSEKAKVGTKGARAFIAWT